ncbi:MAG: peptidoglycan editing factor PgeF [Candidatus Brocadiales bacterium]
MKKIEDGLVYYQFSYFERYYPRLRHVITTRIGGYSKRPFDTLNVGSHVGDDIEDVIKNRDLVCKKLGYTVDSIVAMKQSHGANVKAVDSSFKGRGARRWGDGIDDTDGIVTASRELILFTTAADCSMGMFYDPTQRVLALAHSGWSGVISGIFNKIVVTMERDFHCERKDILVGIGPTICGKCYEIGDETVKMFQDKFPHYLGKIISTSREGGRALDIVKALELQLLEEGIGPDHIEVSGLCTACNTKEFYSYRLEKKDTGRLGIFAVMD